MEVSRKREYGLLEEPNKIRRPPNAFMIYANENRKNMAILHPGDSNKEISKKLGCSWRKLGPNDKEKYFLKARAADREHKRKYPDYVYNPQEARVRKAMRDANRDRSIGASPMLPRPSARRATPSFPGWPPSSIEEPPQQAMTHLGPPPGMHRPTCYTPHPNSDQYLPISSFNKFSQHHQASPQIQRQVPPPPPTACVPTPAPSTNYLQPNPLAQLQHQTEMWQNYQDDVRPQSRIGNSYMMPEAQPHPYHHHQPSPPLSIPSPLMMDKHRQTPLPLHPLMTPPLPPVNAPVMPMTPPHSINSNMSMTPPHSNENICPEEPVLPQAKQQRVPSQQITSFKQEVDVLQPLLDDNIQVKQPPAAHENYMPVFNAHVDDTKMNKMLESHLLYIENKSRRYENGSQKSSKCPELYFQNFQSKEQRYGQNHEQGSEKIEKKNEIVTSFNNIKFMQKYGLENITQLDFITTPRGFLPIAFIDHKPKEKK